MSVRIGLLVPRSVEYPAMSFDLLDGLRINLKRLGLDHSLHMENIGFGEDPEQNHARAEKLVMQDDVQFIIAYATSLNAESLYSLAETTGRPILFLDAGMEVFEAPPHPLCYHLTLQGLTACKLNGEKAGEGQRKVISAVSFLDGGYRSSWFFHNAITAQGGSICGNFVSHYRPEEFSLAQFRELVRRGEAQSVTAAFSSYFAGLFMNALKQEEEAIRGLPFYCSPFMADEQLLGAIPFPGGTFHAIVPWVSAVENEANKLFVGTIQKEKNKTANLFHLLGWEAAVAAERIASQNIAALGGWSFESPRGEVRFHPQTHSAFAPLYEGRIEAGPQGECRFSLNGKIDVSADAHHEVHFAKPEGEYSRWRNNFFCI